MTFVHLVRYGRPLGPAIKDLITVVWPRTFLHWANGTTRSPRRGAHKPGRPRTADSIRELVLRIAPETGWGYSRITGELKKLGIYSVSRTTVVKFLKEAGFDTGPRRAEGSWTDFLQRYASTLWACDFLTKKVWTASGMVDYFVLVFLHLGSRQVHIAGITANSNAAWVVQHLPVRDTLRTFFRESRARILLTRSAGRGFASTYQPNRRNWKRTALSVSNPSRAPERDPFRTFSLSGH